MKRSLYLFGLLTYAVPCSAWTTAPLLPARNTQRTPSALCVSSLNKRSTANSKDGVFLSDTPSNTLASPMEYVPRKSQWSPSNVEASLRDFWMPVASASLLITGNTFGASSLALPQLVQQPGLAASSSVFVAAYLINLLSGLVIAEVAIQQKESSGTDVPSSFKELVQDTLQSPSLATLISLISFSVNALVFSFDMSRVGLVANQLTGGLVGAPTIVVLYGASLVALLSTQSTQRISNGASLCVTVLFASFGSLLLPGLAHTDALAAWSTPGLATNPTESIANLAPVILMAMIYQNIVPTIARLHDYDRTKTVVSMVMGSVIPLLMYLAWCFACLGGGIDLQAVGLDSGPLLAVFSMATLAGSSIGCGLSCASEIETFMGKADEETDDSAQADSASDTVFQLPSVLATVGLPLCLTLTVTMFGNGDLTPALSVAGGLGSPLLYGVLPVWMAWNQRQRRKTDESAMVPTSSLGLLGVCAGGMFGTEMMEQVSQLAHVTL